MSTPTPRPPDGNPPTVRDIAARVGVSAMTVSRALRNQPIVSAQLRAAVQGAARELGYKPDPEVAKLMHHLRLRRKPAFQGSLCALTTVSPNAPHRDFSHAIVAGARRQAQARGYGFSTVSIKDLVAEARTLPRILRSRGVDGILLLPMVTPARLEGLLDWGRLSVVATTSSVLAPDFHSVTPHHFRNTQMLCGELHARGYRRVGVVLAEEHVQRVQHAITAAVTWHDLFAQGTFVPPLIYRGPEPAGLREWFERERPDAIVTHTERLCRKFADAIGAGIPGPVGFVSTNVMRGSAVAGIDEVPEEIGAMAVDQLTSMIQRGEKGVPLLPAATLLRGRWVTGVSCPKRRKVSVAPAARERPWIYREPRLGG